MKNKHDKNLGIILFFISITMLALAYASVPLYRLFCAKTGFGGTPKINQVAISEKTVDREITVQFVANTQKNLPWRFIPLQNQIKVKIGENALAFYRAENLSSKPIVGMATYNVSPDKAGIYFNKIACFCFEEQLLEPKQAMDMPVQFFVDPQFAQDPDLDGLNTITLSYTFFQFKN